jgi:hypothetical protein
MSRLIRRQPDTDDEASAAHRAAEAEQAPRFDAGAAMLPAGRGSAGLRAATLQAMQQQSGNRAVQRWVSGGDAAVQRIPVTEQAQEQQQKQQEQQVEKQAEQEGTSHLIHDPSMSPALRAVRLANLSATQRASFDDQEANIAGTGRTQDESPLPESVDRGKLEIKKRLVDALEAGSTPRGRQLLTEALMRVHEHFRQSNFVSVAIWILYSEGAPVKSLMEKMAGIPEGTPKPDESASAGQLPPPPPLDKNTPNNPLSTVVGLLADKVEADLKAAMQAAWNSMGSSLASNPGAGEAVTNLVDRYISHPSLDSWWRPILIDAAAH